MNTDKPGTALLIVVIVALVCSVLVSASAIGLRPIQERNALIERSRNIVALSGLVEPGRAMSGDEILAAIDQMDVRVLDIDTGEFDDSIDLQEFDPRAAVLDPDLGIAIPTELDLAQLGRRSRYEIVYLVWDGQSVTRVILPIVGQGMWSTLYGYIALESDLNTIAAATFYEQAETAGLGDKITDPDWLATWQGRALYGTDGRVRFRVAAGPVESGSPAAAYEVDAISGASVTGSAVSRLVEYWFSRNGYAPFLENLRNEPPQRMAALERSER
ncbi:MAG: Na(+)-translocating NADH-quinone reductase subunit C [Woeseiaceae bacterium]